MPRTREVLYLLYNKDERKVLSYGMEFYEFVKCLNKKPNNILVLEGKFCGSSFDYTTRCEMCYGDDLDVFMTEDVYNYGDFCWVDFVTEEKLKTLTPSEIGELLYLGKLQKPINSPFFTKLENRFTYLAHDDGWRNIVYYKDAYDYVCILGNLIKSKLEKLHNIHVESLGENVINELVELSEDGLTIDFENILVDEEESSFELSMYGFGKIENMSSICFDYERHIASSSHKKSLEYDNNKWSVQDYY